MHQARAFEPEHFRFPLLVQQHWAEVAIGLSSEDFSMDTPTPSNSGDDPDFMARLRAMLRLPQTAMEDEIADAIAKALDMRPDPEKFVPIEALQSVMEDRTQMATAQAQGRAETKVAQAIAQGQSRLR
jgi:hypothetical protein